MRPEYAHVTGIRSCDGNRRSCDGAKEIFSIFFIPSILCYPITQSVLYKSKKTITINSKQYIIQMANTDNLEQGYDSVVKLKPIMPRGFMEAKPELEKIEFKSKFIGKLKRI